LLLEEILEWRKRREQNVGLSQFLVY